MELVDIVGFIKERNHDTDDRALRAQGDCRGSVLVGIPRDGAPVVPRAENSVSSLIRSRGLCLTQHRHGFPAGSLRGRIAAQHRRQLIDSLGFVQ